VVHAHPLVNFKATALSPKDLLRFLEAEGHPAQLIAVPVNAST
jgi:Ala-tRNA(Pro) deacylase